jgi:hypothetical protein
MAELTLTRAGIADAGAFLARLGRVDRAALVRLRPKGPGRIALWSRLPWEVLVTRTAEGALDVDATLPAAGLLAALAPAAAGEGGPVPLRPRRDEQWRWALPPSGARVVEELPAALLRRLGSAAEQTVRAATGDGVAGRAVGERAVRDALLDHEAVVVENTVTNSTVERIVVPQRLVQAVVRMGFLRPSGDAAEPPARVLVAGGYVGLGAEYGVAWYPKSAGLAVWAIV